MGQTWPAVIATGPKIKSNSIQFNVVHTSSASLGPVPRYSDDHITLLLAVCTPSCENIGSYVYEVSTNLPKKGSENFTFNAS